MSARGKFSRVSNSVLAEKDLALARSRSEAAEAAAAAIAAELRDAERVRNRTQTLSRQNFASDADLTKAEARVDVLRAQLRQAEAQTAAALLDAQRAAAILDKHQIRAPFGGVVIERSAQPGEMISPMSAGGFTRTGVCTIVDMDSIEIEVDVSEAFIGRVSAGTHANAVLDAYPNWTIPGAVIAIVPAANREKATVKVRIGLKQKDPRILPDMFRFPDACRERAVGQAMAGIRKPEHEETFAAADGIDSIRLKRKTCTGRRACPSHRPPPRYDRSTSIPGSA